MTNHRDADILGGYKHHLDIDGVAKGHAARRLHSRLIVRSALIPLVAVACAALAASVAYAQSPFAGLPTLKALPAPAEPDAIPLYPGVAPSSAGARQHEVWTDINGDRSVRNVTRPTITPYLPKKGGATGAAVIVAPGGAFLGLSIDNEGGDVARWWASHGVAAFVLKYRVSATPEDLKDLINLFKGPPPNPFTNPARALALQDAQTAVRLVRSRGASWSVDPHRLGFIGFSAGAITTLDIGLVTDLASRPDFLAPIYGPLAAVAVPADAPPLFTALASDDPFFATGDYGLVTAWQKAKRPVEFHLYEKGGHGFGMHKQGTTSDLWIEELYRWMKSRGLLKRPASRAR